MIDKQYFHVEGQADFLMMDTSTVKPFLSDHSN